MAVNTSWYVMDNKIGVNLNKVVTSVTLTSNPTQPEYPGLPHNLGDRVQGNDGSEWLFVLASATVSAFNVVAIDANNRCANLTTALFASGVYTFGIAEFQTLNGVSVGAANGGVANAGDAFWALMKAANGAKVNLVTSVSGAAGTGLFVGSEPGRLTTTGSASRLVGIQNAVSVQGTVTEAVFPSYILPSVQIMASAASA
jgi:hypothetical protein